MSRYSKRTVRRRTIHHELCHKIPNLFAQILIMKIMLTDIHGIFPINIDLEVSLEEIVKLPREQMARNSNISPIDRIQVVLFILK